jgi:hypothetical protein
MIKIDKKDFKKLYDKACEAWTRKFNEKFAKFMFVDYIEFEDSYLEEMRVACTSEQLEIFNSIFKEFLPKNKFEGIKDYKSFCKISGKKELELSMFEFLDNPKKSLAQAKINQYEDYFNSEQKLDWDNHDQAKWYVWYNTGSCSLAFLGVDYYYFDFGGGAGYFINRETAEFVGKTFIDDYKNLIY